MAVYGGRLHATGNMGRCMCSLSTPSPSRYLTALDLFHAFDHLNNRFSTLIQSIPLDLNFANVSNSKVKQFCLDIQNNPFIKQQVHSLHLSDEKSLQHTDIFLSYFSIDKFSSLKSLVLTQVLCSQYSSNGYEIIESLQSIPDLSGFLLNWNCSNNSNFEMPDDISLSKLKRLSIPVLSDDHLMFNQPWLTTSLTLSLVSIEQIVKIFQCVIKLRDFNINNHKLQGDYLFNSDETTDFQGCSATHLKRLRIKTSNRRFQIIENLLQHTPNQKVFTLIANRAKEMMDADRWKNLIHRSLIHLTDFQFQFSFLQVAFPDTKTNILSKFERFQGDFWKKEHQWLVRCVCSASSFMIHTIPYPSNNYILSLSTEHYSSELMNPKSVFDRVTNISVLYEMMEIPCLSYFSNVKVLRLTNNSTSQGLEPQYTLDCKHVESLKSFICLSNVTDLLIDRNYSLKSSSVMINLLNEASNISSLTIDLQMFRLLRVDDQVCSIFKRMIKSLFLLNDGYNALFSKVYSFEQFYHTFSDLEELECDLDDPSDFITLIQSLSNLSRISVCFTRWYSSSQFEYSWHRQYFNIISKDFYCISEDVVPEQHGRVKRFVMSFRRRFR